MNTLDGKLLNRSLGQKRVHESIKPLYGDHFWVKDLDIVNELGGHSGCVNALSWSTSGRFLASGSDDTYLNIWEYNPDGQAKPFTLNTSVSTGHTANIFSVKFMPHSNDNTVVSCAGDSEVRVFDLEYSASNQTTAARPSESTRTRKFQEFFGACKWLSHANTNAKIYRSHADRVKRVVTESSPFIFLTCSEDGEVRQWDLRQPSSAYPPPRYSRNYGHRRHSAEEEFDAPPALISYKQYGLDLNTISCSKSQPQYIALGGAHLHCFLHDRRMLGRNIHIERGTPLGKKPELDSQDDEAMTEATRCVRRFAPNNKRKMRAGAHAHITACKISDARPNELIASWSADHVYSFDIVKSPDARDMELEQDKAYHQQLRDHAIRKRKRTQVTTSSTSVGDGAVQGRRLRKVSNARHESGHTMVRVHDGSRSSPDLDLDDADSSSIFTDAHETLIPEANRSSERIARALVELRKAIFSSSASTSADEETSSADALTTNTSAYTQALGLACMILPEIEQSMKDWRYPQTQDEDEIMLQNTLRRNRQAVWRFVQAAGVLARSLGGQIHTASADLDPRLAMFEMVRPAPLERTLISNESRFYYDFLKAITTWLNANGSLEPLKVAFERSSDTPRHTERFPLDPGTTGLDHVASSLRDYLAPLADSNKPVLELGTNQFETEEYRTLYPQQTAAVTSFTGALEAIAELRLGHGPGTETTLPEHPERVKRIMDKGAAARLWGERVGRALLMDAAEGITFNTVNRAFGGVLIRVTEDDSVLDTLLEEAADHVTDHELISAIDGSDGGEPQTADAVSEIEHNEGDVGDDSESEASYSDDEDDEAAELMFHQRRSNVYRRKAFVNNTVSYTSHSKTYKGHCNTRTVKDVNYFGLDDEYVVSGSDDGRFFVWDRETTEIVGVFEGDGEVVNVIQGHPYEPMIACSGIDSTVKIFGSGGNSRERHDARRGVNVANPGGGRHSSLNLLRSRTDRMEYFEARATTQLDREGIEDLPIEDEDSILPGGLKSRKVSADRIYEITSQNDVERQRGMGDAFMTRGMLARLALALQNGELQGIEGIGGQGFGGQGGTLVVDENCTTM